jgi:hypothetical protein
MFLKMLDPSAALKVWNESLPRCGDGRPRLAGLSVVDAAVGKRWSVQYRPASTGHEPAPLLVAQRFPEDELDTALAKMRRRWKRSRRHPRLEQWVGSRPEEGLLLFPFQLDARISPLFAALDPETAWRFAAACPQLELPAGEAPEKCTVEALRYVPGKRCQIRYTFRCKGKIRRVLGKVFRDNRGERLFRAMNSVAAHFESQADPDLTAPRPLAYLPEWQVLLQTHLPGKTLHELLQQGAGRNTHLLGAARSIALLHAGRFPVENQHFFEDEVSLVSRSVANLQAAGLADLRFEAVRERVANLAGGFSPVPGTPVHRDFHDKQLLVHGRRIALIDLDTLALGFPEIDVANFIAHLHLRRLQGVPGGSSVSAWDRLFVQEYRRHSIFTLEIERTRFFMAAAFLRLACKYRAKLNSLYLADGLLHLAGQTLEAEPNQGVLRCFR